jgi:DNA mismatch repair ATPase MutL
MQEINGNIQLQPLWRKRYNVLRILLLCIFLFIIANLVYVVLFPSLTFNYFFRLENALKNTVSSPRSSNQNSIAEGKTADKKLLFDTALTGNFSDATINFTLEKDSAKPESAKLKVRRSYQAFFYPLGNPIGFKEGTLLTDGEGYFQISDGVRRPFTSLQAAQNLGFTKSMFVSVTQEELQLNPGGEMITNYANGTLFKIGNEFYQLNNETLYQFVSNNAFLSRYEDNQAIVKDANFLNNFNLSQDQLGFADGTIVSLGNSIFILSEGRSYPVDTPETFQALGYSWEDVIPASSEEVGIYKKQKVMTQATPHVSGTIFLDQKDDKYYIVRNNQKLPLIGNRLIQNYLHSHPIIADSRGLEKVSTCDLKKNTLVLRSYSCDIALENLSDLKGNDYQFAADFDTNIRIEQLDVMFHTAPKLENARQTLSQIKTLIKINYQNKQQQ